MINAMTYFDVVNVRFLDGDVHHRASYGAYISQLIRFARVCNHVADFNAQKMFNGRAIGIINFEIFFLNFYRRHYELLD